MKTTTLALTLLSTVFALSNAQAKSQTLPPYFPSASIKIIAGDLGVDGCILRINPPSVTEYKYSFAACRSSDCNAGGYFETSLATYLSTYGSSSTYYGGSLTDSAVKETSIPFVVQASNGQKTLQMTRIQATVSPVLLGNTDASALAIGNLLPVLDEVNFLLLGLPNAAEAALNGSINRWNQVFNDAKATKQAQATLKVSEVTEWKIQQAMEVIADAQAILLVKYACDGVDVAKYADAVNAYLNRLTDAVTTLNTH